MPLFIRSHKPYIGVWKIEESVDELLALLPCTSTACKSSLSGMNNDRRRREWLASRILLKELTGEEAVISYRPSGAPYVWRRKTHISISHTKDYAAIVLDNDYSVGIDIEYPNPRAQKVKKRFLSPEEEAFLDNENEMLHSLICWCAKEAIYKCMGSEESDFKWDFCLKPFPFGEEGEIEAVVMRYWPEKKRVFPRLGYIATKYFVMVWLFDNSAVSRPLSLNSAMTSLLFPSRT
jgi:phosphopantetheinyl transferase (holo-ACP synthase)